MITIAGIVPVAKWLAKIKQQSPEQRGTSTEKLPEETYGRINGAFCDGIATTVTGCTPFHLACNLHQHQRVSSCW